MRRFRSGPLLLLCLICSVSASAQQSTSTSAAPTSDPQAVALVHRSLAELTGGVAVTDVTLTGTAHRIAGSDDETGTATLEATSAGDSRVDLLFPSGNRTEIRNPAGTPLSDSFPPNVLVPAVAMQSPQPVGAWSGPDGVTHGMAGHNVMTDATWFFPALTLATVTSSPSYVLSYIGPDTMNGQAVIHVAVSQPFVAPSGVQVAPGPPGTTFAALKQQLSQMDIYLDPTTSLPVALFFNAHPDSNALVNIPVQIQFSNYQASNGIQVPLHVQKYLNNSLILDLLFTNVTLNSGLSATSFQFQ